MSFPLLSPFFAPSVILLSFLPNHFAILAMVLFDLCLLGFFWACCLFLMTQYGHWIYTYATLGFLDSLHCLWALLSHFFLLRHPWPIFFPWASLAHFLILHSHGLLLTLLGFPDPITLSFILGLIGFSSTPYFLTSLLRAYCDPFSIFYIT